MPYKTYFTLNVKTVTEYGGTCKLPVPPFTALAFGTIAVIAVMLFVAVTAGATS